MAAKAVHHIPLIMKIPGISQPGHVNNDLLYNVDVIATIADLVGLSKPSGWDGTSFLPAVQGKELEGRDYLVLEHGLYACQRAVCDQKWFYIHTFHEGFYDFPEIVLYDLENDPHQTKNVANAYPQMVALMEGRLQQWVEENMNKNSHKIDPMQNIVDSGGPFRYMEPQQWIDRLERAGWQKQAEQLKMKYIRE